jgi:serine/threonine protein kinase
VLHSDFGLGCQLTAERRYRVSGQAGTKGYQAPEVLQNAHYGCEVDVFSYGIVIYELVHNQRPWRSGIGNGGGGGDNDEENAADILARFKDLPLSSKLSPALASFLRAVLTPDWRQRIGCAPKKVAADGSYSSADQRVDWGQMKSHEFFAGIDWDMLYAKKVPPPFVPDNSRANCSPEADLADQLLDHKPRKITEEQQKNFEGWAFNTDLGTLPKPAANAAASGGGADASTTAAGGAGSSGSNGVAAAAAPGHDQKQPTRPSPSPSPSPSPGQTAAAGSDGAGAAASGGGGRNSRRTTPLVTAPVIVAPAPVHVHAAPAATEPVEAEA